MTETRKTTNDKTDGLYKPFTQSFAQKVDSLSLMSYSITMTTTKETASHTGARDVANRKGVQTMTKTSKTTNDKTERRAIAAGDKFKIIGTAETIEIEYVDALGVARLTNGKDIEADWIADTYERVEAPTPTEAPAPFNPEFRAGLGEAVRAEYADFCELPGTTQEERAAEYAAITARLTPKYPSVAELAARAPILKTAARQEREAYEPDWAQDKSTVELGDMAEAAGVDGRLRLGLMTGSFNRAEIIAVLVKARESITANG